MDLSVELVLGLLTLIASGKIQIEFESSGSGICEIPFHISYKAG